MGKVAESSIVAKCAHVLDVLSEAGEPVSFSHILQHTSIPKSSCHRILAVLQTELLVEYNHGTKAYSIGSRLRDWSRAEWRRKDLQQAASESMANLSDLTGMNTALSILDRDTILYVRTVNVIPFRYASHSGDHAPLHCTAAGKIFLSHLSGTRLRNIVKTMDFEKFTERSVTEFDKLREQFPSILQQGFAVARQEEALQVTGIAAPVFNLQDELIACLSLWTLHTEASPDTIISQSSVLIDAADAISARLGWTREARQPI